MSDPGHATDPYKAPETVAANVDVARDRAPVLHRGGGALAVAAGVVLLYISIGEHTYAAKGVGAGAFIIALGAWMVIFGYPRNAEGLAPVWWRAGLVLTAIIVLLATVSAMSQ